jgi:hypothetical protein
MNINFIHVRRWTKPRGFLREDKNLRGETVFPFLSNFGGATIAYNVHRQADSIIVHYAVAECCDTDRFNKTIGRELSTVRLENNTLCGVIEMPANVEDAVQEALVEDWLTTKEAAIKESANGSWVDAIILSDYYQPVNPGYVWNIAPGEVEHE